MEIDAAMYRRMAQCFAHVVNHAIEEHDAPCIAHAVARLFEDFTKTLVAVGALSQETVNEATAQAAEELAAKMAGWSDAPESFGAAEFSEEELAQIRALESIPTMPEEPIQ